MVNQIFLKDQQFVNALEKGCRRYVLVVALVDSLPALSSPLPCLYARDAHYRGARWWVGVGFAQSVTSNA